MRYFSKSKAFFKLGEVLLRAKATQDTTSQQKTPIKEFFVIKAFLVLAQKCSHCEALAKQWTCGESDPGLDHAMIACYRYTTGPRKYWIKLKKYHKNAIMTRNYIN